MASLQFVISTDTEGAIIGLRRYKSELAAVGTTAQSSSNDATSAFDRIERIVGKARSAVIGFIAAFAFREVIIGFEQLIGASIEFDASFNKITRVLSLSSAEIASLRSEMLELSKTIPINVNELNELGGLAAQLGVSSEGMKSFLTTVSQMSIAAGTGLHETADQLARFAVIMDIPIEKIGTFASVVTKLGNDALPATEGEILRFGMNIAGSARTVGMSSEQVAALAAALASTGLHAEKAGSSISRILVDMGQAADTGGRQLGNFASVAGKLPEEFRNIVRTNPSEALILFLGGLQRMEHAGGGAIKALNDLGLSNVRVRDVALRAAAGIQFLREATESASAETQRATALQDKFARAMESPKEQLKLLRNGLHALIIQISEDMQPAVFSAIRGFVSFAEFLVRYANAVEAASVAIGVFVAAMATMRIASWISSFELFKDAVLALELIMMKAATTSDVLAFALSGLKVSASLVFGALGLAAGAIYLIAKNGQDSIDSISAATRVWDEQGPVLQANMRTMQGVSGNLTLVNRLHGEGKEQLRGYLDATLDVSNATNTASKQDENRARRIQDIVDGISGATKKEAEFVAGLKQAEEEGISARDILAAYSSRIEALIKLYEKEHETLPPVLQVLDDYAKAQEALENTQEARIISQRALREEEEKELRVQYALNDAVAIALHNYRDVEMERKGEAEAWNIINARMETNSRIREKLGRFTVEELPTPRLPTAEYPSAFVGPVPTAEQRAGAANDYRDRMLTAGKAWIDKVVEDTHKMFADMIGHGKSFWEAFSHMGLNVAASIASSFFDKMLHFFLDPFQVQLGKILDKVTDKLSRSFGIGGVLGTLIGGLAGSRGGLFGGGVAGGLGGAAAGGLLGGMAGSFVHGMDKTFLAPGAGVFDQVRSGWKNMISEIKGHPIQMAIQGAIVGFTALASAIGAGRREANRFVQAVQEPFAKSIEDIFKSLQKASDMGTLTVHQVGAAQDQVELLWETFQKEAAKAQHGVGTQALATMEPFMEIWRDWLKTFDQAAADLERTKKIKDITDIVANAADGWDLMERALQNLMDTEMDWGPILVLLGGRVSDLADKMRLMGIAIPPAMQAILDVKESFDRLKQIEEVKNIVLDAAKGWEIMEEALQGLKVDTVTTAQIAALLGGRIRNLADVMHLMGVEIPPAMQSILDYMDAHDRMSRLMQRQAAIENEITQVRQQTLDALNRKIGLLEDGIHRAENAIVNWSKGIRDANDSIEKAEKQLRDTDFWQKMYNDSIKDSQKKLEDAIKDREDTEKRIARLSADLERDRLQNTLEFARTTEDAILISRAEIALKGFESEQRRLENADRIKELQRLENDLPKAVLAEQRAKEAADAARVAADDAISARKHELEMFIASKQSEREQLEATIKAEENRIAAMRADVIATERLVEMLGGTRRNEMQQVSDTINKLIERGYALEAERDKLSQITGIAAATTNIFGLLGTAFTNAAQKAVDAMDALLNVGVSAAVVGKTVASAAEIIYQTTPFGTRQVSGTFAASGAPGITTEAPTISVKFKTASSSGGTGSGPVIVITPDVSEYVHPWSPPNLGIAQLQHGLDVVPRDMYAMLHAGERITPAWKNRDGNWGNSVSYAPAISVNVTMNGNTDRNTMRRFVRDDVIPEILDAVQVNSHRVVDRLSNALKKSQPNMVLK